LTRRRGPAGRDSQHLLTKSPDGSDRRDAAIAQDYSSPWSFGGSVGVDIPVSGKLHGAGDSAALNLRTLNTNLSGTGILRIRGRDYADLYDNGIRANLEVRYAMSEASEFFGSVSYLEAKGKEASIGCVDITATTGTCESDLLAQFSDYKQYGLEVGYRQWLGGGMMGGAIKPYFAVRGGVTRTDAISALVSTPTADLANLRFYDETWNFMIGGDVGATVAISPNAEFGAEVGIRYVTKLDRVDLDLNPVGLGTLNDDEDGRVSVPVSVRLNAAF
jgi:hypothetical protein